MPFLPSARSACPPPINLPIPAMPLPNCSVPHPPAWMTLPETGRVVFSRPARSVACVAALAWKSRTRCARSANFGSARYLLMPSRAILPDLPKISSAVPLIAAARASDSVRVLPVAVLNESINVSTRVCSPTNGKAAALISVARASPSVARTLPLEDTSANFAIFIAPRPANFETKPTPPRPRVIGSMVAVAAS